MRIVKLSASALAVSLALTAAVPAIAQTATAPAAVVVVPDGYTITEFTTITPEQMTGATIYDTEGNEVGKITNLVIGPDNAVTGMVTDVSTFVGVEKHEVDLKPEHIHVYRNAAGDLRAVAVVTREELKEMPVHTER
ncbi:PRC-barrel domain-containing protein [Falsigemmobacter faecalis]|uniref:Uncharacterized protein n=1 Tax=Falsigemmobacter faecalis TaxID=2488730 RepID=A0A3P3D0V9_9RHOB|nr:PRC-barrel domain-containing protein [Falsigemmobacter faecalis]RRH68070.1 hypothetical protein EG244_19880 [Falsigemmobacter faecalis]